MANTFADSVPDAALDKIATATTVHLCTGDPADRAGAISASVGNYTLTAGDGGGDYTIANGDTSGRKLTLAAQTGNNLTGSGTAAHLCFIDGSELLRKVALSATQVVTSGNPFTISSFVVLEIRDPS